MAVTNTGVPLIRVEDCTINPPAVTNYYCPDNELDFKLLYITIKSLHTHPGLGGFKIEGGVGPSFKECSKAFRDVFRWCAAGLADYFADFAANDSVFQRSLSFMLADRLLNCAQSLPHNAKQHERPFCAHSARFNRDLREQIKVLNSVMTQFATRANWRVHWNDLIVTRRQRKKLTAGYKSGLDSWQQYLLNGSPGFAVPQQDRVTTKDVLPVDDRVREQHLPPGALAIIQRHTMIHKAAAVRLAEREPERYVDYPGGIQGFLADFDRKSVRIGDSYALQTPSGRQATFQYMHPNPDCANTPYREEEPGDPSYMLELPSLQMIDEVVATFRGGMETIPHPRGGDGIFHMLSVTATRDCSHPEPSCQKRKGMVKPVEEALKGPMFDHWFMRD